MFTKRRTALIAAAGLLVAGLFGPTAAASHLGGSGPTTPVSPPAAPDSRLTPQQLIDSGHASQGDCAQVRADLDRLAADGKDGIVSCLQRTDTQQKLSGSEFGRADVLPLPDFCFENPLGPWWFFRDQACQIATWQFTLIDVNTRVVVGTLDFFTFGFTFTSDITPVWGFQAEIRPFRATGLGTAGVIVNGLTTCLGACVVPDAPMPPHPVVVNEPIGQSWFPESTATTAGSIGNGDVDFTFTFAHPSAINTATGVLSPPRVRCDNALPERPSGPAGCVFPDFQPVLIYSLTGPYPELAAHIRDAQASGLPGAFPGGPPLHRLTDSTLINRNRDLACPASLPRPPGKSCDEYPFASTHEGAFTSGGAFSQRMIDATQNSVGGSEVATRLNRPNRVLEGDAYLVWITP